MEADVASRSPPLRVGTEAWDREFRTHFAAELSKAAQLRSDLISLINHEYANGLCNMNLGLALLRSTESGTLDETRGHSYEMLKRTLEKLKGYTANFLNQAKKQGRPVIAVGTTATRTLEAAAKNLKLTTLSGTTDLFIRPGYKFKFVDGLITNFHVPKSSLIMLVSAFIDREKLLAVYQQAINKHFRFFSFGDGMLILPN